MHRFLLILPIDVLHTNLSTQTCLIYLFIFHSAGLFLVMQKILMNLSFNINTSPLLHTPPLLNQSNNQQDQ